MAGRIVAVVRVVAALIAGLVWTWPGGPAVAGEPIQLKSWGIDLEGLGLPYGNTAGSISLSGLYKRENRLFLHVFTWEDIDSISGQRQFIVDADGGTFSSFSGELGPEYKKLETVHIIEGDGYVVSAITTDSVSERQLCQYGPLLGFMYHSNRKGDFHELFFLRTVNEKKPVMIKMVSHDGCMEILPPPHRYYTRTPVVAGWLRMTDLGDGTVLVWDDRWTSDVIRFRLSDGTTPYVPKKVKLVNGEVIDRIHREAAYRPDVFQKKLADLLKTRGN